TDPEIPGTIGCPEKSFQVITALIRWSSFYLGQDSGISWLATTTNTPMAVFMDTADANRVSVGFHTVLRDEKKDIQEWDIYTSLQTVLERIQSTAAIQLRHGVRV